MVNSKVVLSCQPLGCSRFGKRNLFIDYPQSPPLHYFELEAAEK